MISSAPARSATRLTLLATAGLAAIGLAGCATASSPSVPMESRPASSAPHSPAPDTRAPDAPATTTAPASVPDEIVGTVLRFTSDRTSVDVTVQEDSPAVRDLLSRLPLDITMEDLVDREKIAYLSPELDWAGSPGSDPEDGDLIYYTPWGNLGFYYDAEGIGYSEATLHIGTYAASPDQLELLEGAVTVDVVG